MTRPKNTQIIPVTTKWIFQTSLALLASNSAIAQSTTVTWRGTSSGNWSVNTNWNSNQTLVNDGNYRVSLGANSTLDPIVTTNDLTNLTLSRLAIESTSITTPYVVAGNAVTLTGNIVNRGTQSLTVNLDIKLSNTISSQGDSNKLQLFSGDTSLNSSYLYLNGVLSGEEDSYAFITGATDVIFGGSQANTFAGKIVAESTLILNKSAGVNAIAGDLQIYNGNAVKLHASDQISDSSTVSFRVANSRLELNGFSETLGNIVSENTGAGLIQNASSTAESTLTLSNSSNISFSGKFANGNSQRFNLIKSGSNTLTLSGSSSYTGTTLVTNGGLVVANANALGGGGNIESKTTVNSGAYVAVSGNTNVTNEIIEITGSGGAAANGALRAIGTAPGQTSTWGGEVHLGAATDSGNDPSTQAARVGGHENADLWIAGKITDNSLSRDLGIRNVSDSARTILSNSTNTYRSTYLVIGHLVLGGNNALPLTSTLHLGNFSGFGAVTFDLAGYTQTLPNITTLGSNSVTRRITNTSSTASTLTWSVASDTPQTYGDSTLTNTLITGNLNLRKTGSGTLTLGSANTYTGLTTISSGSLVMNHTNALGAAGSLANGTVVSSGGNLTLNAGLTINDEILTISGNGGSGGFGALRTSGATSETATWNGDVILGADSGVDPHTGAPRIGANGAKLQVGGRILDNGGNRDLAIRSSTDNQTVIISGTNNAYRNTYLVIGNLHLGATNALSTVGTLTLGNSTNTGLETFDLKGFNQEVTGLSTLGNIDARKRIINTAGTTSALTINVADGTSFAYNSESYNGSYITGNLELIKEGLGTQTFGGILSHTGKTQIRAGTFVLTGTPGAGIADMANTPEIAISSDATFDVQSLTDGTFNSATTTKITGAGTVDGNLVLAGEISPGLLASETANLTVTGDVEFQSSSRFAADLGSPSTSNHDQIHVGGNLTLGGTLQIQAITGFGVGTYTLFHYTGTQSNTMSVANAPAAYTGTLDSSVANEVQLKIALASGWQIWDGLAADASTIEGGNGVWTNAPTQTNWTDAGSVYQSAWDIDGAHGALFTTTGGTVTVAAGETIKTKGLVFEVDGYSITPGDGSSQIELQPSSVIEVYGGASAFISTPLSGDQLTKTQGGTLVLQAQNTYVTTLIQAGVLEIAEGGSLGTGAVINESTLAFSPTSELQVTQQISGSGELKQIGTGTTVLTANNTYTGSTILQSGVLQLGNGGTSGSITSASIQNDATLAIQRSDALTLAANISGSGELKQIGSGTTVLSGDLRYTGTTEAQSGTLRFTSDTANLGGDIITQSRVEFGQTSNASFSNTISGAGDIVQSGSALLDLTQAHLEHTGNTIVQSGTLASGSMEQATLQLKSGSTYHPAGNLAGTVQVRQLQLQGGKLQWNVGPEISDRIVSLSPATLTAATIFEFDPEITANGLYTLVQNVDSDWNLDLLNAQNVASNMVPTFFVDASVLYFSAMSGEWNSGDLLQNSAPVNIPTTSGFLVTGNASTGTPSESNTIRALSFADESELLIHQTLTITSGEVIMANGSAEISGDRIVTPKDLVKLGEGALTLTNSSTRVGGALRIDEGELALTRSVDIANEIELSDAARFKLTSSAVVRALGNANLAGKALIDGSLQAPKVKIQQGGELSGKGILIGNLHNHGVISPGDDIATLTIQGDFTQHEDGRLKMDIAGLKESDLDQLIVSGTSQLAGTLEISAKQGHSFKYGDRYTILRSGKISGQFEEILFSEDQPFRARFTTSGKGQGEIIMAPQSYRTLAHTVQHKRIAKALDHWIGVTEGDKAEVTLALDSLKAEEYPQAFESMQPNYQASAMDIGNEMGHQHHQTLHQHLSSRRLGQRMAAVQASGQGDGEERPLGLRYSAKASLKESVLPSEVREERWNTWVQSSGMFSSSGMSLTPGEDWESGTILVGADYAVTEHFGIGIYASYQAGRGDFENGGDIDLESSRVGLYATYDRGGFYLNASAGIGQTGFDIKRPVRFGSLSRNAYSEPDGWEWSAMFGGGYDLQLGKWTLGPQFSVTYQRLNLGTFEEHGAGALNLRVHDGSMESLRSYIGARVAYTLQVNDRLSVFPELRAFWQHEYLGASDLRSSFENGTGPEWVYSMDNQNPDAVFMGAGFSWQYGSKLGGSLFYHATFGRNEDMNHTISLSGNLKF